MDPLSIAQIASSSLGNLFSGLFGASAASARAKAYGAAADQAEAEGGVAAQEAILRGNAVAAHAAVQTAANGGGFTGSSLGVISQLSQQAMFNARAASYRANTIAIADRYNTKVQKADSLNDYIGAGIGAVSPAVGGGIENAARTNQLQSLATLRGLGQASPYDYQGLQ